MSGLEALQSVQFVTIGERRLAVVDADDWDALIEWLETVEDVELAHSAYSQLRKSGGNREKAGWLRWEDIQDELD